MVSFRVPQTDKEKMTIRDAKESEYETVGRLMVSVYSAIDGFPDRKEWPAYYEKLARIGDQTKNHGTRLLVALNESDEILGSVLYIEDMSTYHSKGPANKEKDAVGFRLLAVSPKSRGLGVGRKLSEECLSLGRKSGKSQMIIHTTENMPTAWQLYERMGFKRSEDLDFYQGEMGIFGFRFKY